MTDRHRNDYWAVRACFTTRRDDKGPRRREDLHKREDLNLTPARTRSTTCSVSFSGEKMSKTRLIAETSGPARRGDCQCRSADGLEVKSFFWARGLSSAATECYRMRLRRDGSCRQPGSCCAPGRRPKPCAMDDASATRTTASAPSWGHTHFPPSLPRFQSVISSESKQQMLEKEGRLPDAVVACVGGGSNAIWQLLPFHRRPALIGVEGRGPRTTRLRPPQPS